MSSLRWPVEYDRRLISDDLALLRYPSGLGPGHAQYKRVVRDFKAGDMAAIDWVTDQLIDLVHEHASELQRRGCAYILSLPRHDLEPNVPCELVSKELATEFEWLRPLPPISRRWEIRQSNTAYPDDRPDEETHYFSMKYEGPTPDVGSAIVMLDDVRVSGATSGAARRRLRAATGCERAIGLFLARATGA